MESTEWPIDPRNEFAEGLGFLLWHRNGVPWWEAKLPPTLHVCATQTYGGMPSSRVFRCACGAIAHGQPRWWGERNSRSVAGPIVEAPGLYALQTWIEGAESVIFDRRLSIEAGRYPRRHLPQSLRPAA